MKLLAVNRFDLIYCNSLISVITLTGETDTLLSLIFTGANHKLTDDKVGGVHPLVDYDASESQSMISI